MNNPFRPISGTSSGLAPNQGEAPLTYMQEDSNNAPPQPKPFKRGPSLRGVEVVPEEEKKMGFFGKLFGGSKSSKKEKKSEEPDKGSPDPDKKDSFSLPRKSTECEAAGERHSELIQAVDGIRKALAESKAQKVEVDLSKIPPLLPPEHLDSLAKTQVQVSGALEKVAGQLDEAGRRESKVIDSLSQVDGSLGELTRFSEKSVSTMDGMKGVFAKASGSMEAMQSELKKSASRYEELCEKIQQSEKENKETIAQLQKRTLMVMGLLGIALVACLIFGITR